VEFFKKKTNINFLSWQRWALSLSCSLLLLSVVSLFVYGINWGLEFTGGTQIQLSFIHPPDLLQVKDNLKKSGFEQIIVQNYGDPHDVLITLPLRQHLDQQTLAQKILTHLTTAKLKQIEFIGPQVGQDLKTQGILAVLLALGAIILYVSIRFEYRFALGAAIALLHDPILILGLFSIFQIKFDLTALAAILAVIGYSLNDTIVIFDRIRENFKKIKNASPIEIVNRSINETLSRTLITSAITLLVVSSLYLFGGEQLYGFSLALIIGIVVGTYSSIYIAGALALALGLQRKHLVIPPKHVEN
jgi:preprotein translocase subunit SecF